MKFKSDKQRKAAFANMHRGRTSRARTMDNRKTAKMVYDPSNPNSKDWIKKMNRSDVEGIDTGKMVKEDTKKIKEGTLGLQKSEDVNPENVKSVSEKTRIDEEKNKEKNKIKQSIKPHYEDGRVLTGGLPKGYHIEKYFQTDNWSRYPMYYAYYNNETIKSKNNPYMDLKEAKACVEWHYDLETFKRKRDKGELLL